MIKTIQGKIAMEFMAVRLTDVSNTEEIETICDFCDVTTDCAEVTEEGWLKIDTPHSVKPVVIFEGYHLLNISAKLIIMHSNDYDKAFIHQRYHGGEQILNGD